MKRKPKLYTHNKGCYIKKNKKPELSRFSLGISPINEETMKKYFPFPIPVGSFDFQLDDYNDVKRLAELINKIPGIMCNMEEKTPQTPKRKEVKRGNNGYNRYPYCETKIPSYYSFDIDSFGSGFPMLLHFEDEITTGSSWDTYCTCTINNLSTLHKEYFHLSKNQLLKLSEMFNFFVTNERFKGI